ncbi:MAG TPA: ion transporter [Ktedonobacteraceae bacterium]|nr:ion transporter [Ktedonobacteraceae bacterium]
MAANPTTEKNVREERAEKVTAYDLAIGILAIFSLIILIPIYFGNLSSEDKAVLNYLEYALCLIFLLDFFRSLHLAPDKGRYFFRSGGWLDLLGSIPISAFAIFRVARLFRIVRLLRRMSGGELRRMFTGRLAQNTLLFTLVIALLLVFTIAWLVLMAEQGAPNANIKTYHDAVWWAFVTITTVGYGDYYPVTGWGQSFAVILMFFGLGIIGVLSSYLSSTFISLQRRRQEKRGGGNGQDQENEENDEDTIDDETASKLEDELVAIKGELAALRKLFEERYQPQ